MQTIKTHAFRKNVVWEIMSYVPSPITFRYNYMFSAVVNRSGRMQYYKAAPGKSRERISRTDFCTAYNASIILGIAPLQKSPGTSIFQIQFFI